MKNYAIFSKKHNLIVLLLFVIGLINSQLLLKHRISNTQSILLKHFSKPMLRNLLKEKL